MDNQTKKIIVYGAKWCRDCARSRKYLDDQGIIYEYINIDEYEQGAEEIERLNHGLKVVPTIVFPNGRVLAEPSNEALKLALIENNMLS